MGKSRITVRKLPTGEHVHHHPPSERYPEGRNVLIPGPSHLKAKHDERLAHHKHRHETEIKAVHERNLTRKRAALVAGGYPAEKRPI